MTTAQELDLIAETASVLHANGQSTSVTVEAIGRLNTGLGTRLRPVVTWSGVTLLDETGAPIRMVAGSPLAVNMRRVAGAMRAAHDLEDGLIGRDAFAERLAAAARLPVISVWVYALACGLGAACLGLIFGLTAPIPLLIIAASGIAGGFARRGLARLGLGLYPQAFSAALVAGIAAAFAGIGGLDDSAALIAVCPAMVLVPGPPLINGALDVLLGRISLGIARIAYGSGALVAITFGLVVGLAVTGEQLPVLGPASPMPWWSDVLAAGVAAACYAAFFSLPYRMMLWPVLVGAVAHGAHWVAMTVLGFSLTAGAFTASLIVGIALVPISTRLRVPFAGVGFAAIVAMVPGSFVFRALAGMSAIADGQAATADELGGIVADAATGGAVTIALAVGVAVPYAVRNWWRTVRVKR